MLWTVVLEETLESPLEIQPAHPKGNQSWIFIGRTDAEAEAPILWLLHAKNWLIGKNPDAGNNWRQAGGEGDDRGWDGWMASLSAWRWVWTISGSWWRTGRPDLLQSMGLQRGRHNWATELNWRSQRIGFAMLLISICKTSENWKEFLLPGKIESCCCLVAQLCLTLVTPWTVLHETLLSMGIFQARILEGIVIFPSRWSSQPRGQTPIFCKSLHCRWVLYCWATRAAKIEY